MGMSTYHSVNPILSSPAPPSTTLGPFVSAWLGPAPPAPPQSEAPGPEVAVAPPVTLQRTPCPAVPQGPVTGRKPNTLYPQGQLTHQANGGGNLVPFQNLTLFSLT